MPRTPRSRHSHGRSEVWGRRTLTRAIAVERRALGARLRRLRTGLGLSQEAAAERIGIHAKHLQRIETGSVNVTIATLVAVAVAYSVPLLRLFEPETAP